MLFYGIILGCIEVFKVSVKRILLWWKKSLWILCCSSYYIKRTSLQVPIQQDLFLSHLSSVEVFPATPFQFLFSVLEEQTHWKRLWCWEGLGAGGEGDDRGWDGWMASLTRWTWVWVNSGRWWWTGMSGVLRFMGSQRVGNDWTTELNWTHSGISLSHSFVLGRKSLHQLDGYS